MINQHQKQKSKMFLWCHVKHINPSKENPERITKKDRKLVKHIANPEKLHKTIKSLLVILIMMKLSFMFKKKILARLR